MSQKFNDYFIDSVLKLDMEMANTFKSVSACSTMSFIRQIQTDGVLDTIFFNED